MTTTTDALDLQARRKRLGLRQSAVAEMLGVAESSLSEFENGVRQSLPRGLGRKEYEALLTKQEKAARRGSR